MANPPAVHRITSSLVTQHDLELLARAVLIEGFVALLNPMIPRHIDVALIGRYILLLHPILIEQVTFQDERCHSILSGYLHPADSASLR